MCKLVSRNETNAPLKIAKITDTHIGWIGRTDTSLGGKINPKFLKALKEASGKEK